VYSFVISCGIIKLETSSLTMDSRLGNAFSSAAEANKVPGVAAIALDRDGKILFKGAYGVTNASQPSEAAKMTADTPMMIFSCTKLFTSVAALQLMEQGKLNLDDPVEKYVPGIADIQVLDGFESDDKPKLRPAKTKATILQLMTHTAGFTYDFFDANTLRYTLATGGQPSTYSLGIRKLFDTPFKCDPGTEYNYGVNTDWLGFVIEAVSGMRLEEYVEKNITQPLGMKNTVGYLSEDAVRLFVHHRGADGSLTANPAFAAPKDVEVRGGGSYLYSTLNDLSTFLLTILNDGEHPQSNVRILSASTVKDCLFTDQIHKICSSAGIGVISSLNPILSNEGELLPGLKKGWSCGLMLNPEEASPKGRSKGSGSWAGLGNLYYWLDPEQGKLGLTMSSILPFMDHELCHLHDELERAVYGHGAASGIGEVGGNFGLPKV